MTVLTRRTLLGSAMAAGAMGAVPSLQAATSARRFLLVILRGGMDGLAALPPIADPMLKRHRAQAMSAGVIPLPGQSDFALHPELTALRDLWDAGQFIGFHAVGTPYQDRSHFDGQIVLESGDTIPRGSASGWLNRAAAAAGGDPGYAMAIGPRPSLVLTGPAPVGSWSPNALPGARDATLELIARLWAEDPLLAPHLEQALNQQDVTAGMDNGAKNVRRAGRSITPMMAGASALLARADGPTVMALDNAGWDTHVRMEAGLSAKLKDLDTGIETLKRGLGPVWDQTAVLVVTEFGRTVALNGNQGTDHGVGGAAFLFGGAVNGGRIIADWPGLNTRDLVENRDLRVTLDLRRVFREALTRHVGLPVAAIETDVLPGLGASRGLDGLFRTA